MAILFTTGRSDCITSSSLESVSEQGDTVTYQMKISYDKISSQDSDHPVVLVVEWRDIRGKDHSEHIFLEDLRSSSRRISRVVTDNVGVCGTGCLVSGASLVSGEVVEDRDLCITISCSEGAITIGRLPQCQQTTVNNDLIVFPDDFSILERNKIPRRDRESRYL